MVRQATWWQGWTRIPGYQQEPSPLPALLPHPSKKKLERTTTNKIKTGNILFCFFIKKACKKKNQVVSLCTIVPACTDAKHYGWHKELTKPETWELRRGSLGLADQYQMISPLSFSSAFPLVPLTGSDSYNFAHHPRQQQ